MQAEVGAEKSAASVTKVRVVVWLNYRLTRTTFCMPWSKQVVCPV